MSNVHPFKQRERSGAVAQVSLTAPDEYQAFMPSWTIEPTVGDADKALDAWAVFDLPFYGTDQSWTCHFIGFERGSGKDQVSAPALAFDPDRRCGRTQSCRIDWLTGRPGGSADAIYTWNLFKHTHAVMEERNVTAEVQELLPHASRN